MLVSDPTQTQKFHDLLSKFKTAMLVTHTGGGDLRARPMAIAQVEPNCRVWFFTGVESGKVHEIETDTHVSVVCQRDRDIYLSLSGLATLSRDRAKIDELWTEELKTWFPKGKEDPNVGLMAVQPEVGEYWDQEGFNKIKYLFEAAKAYATGTTPKVEEGDQHGKIALS
jgi:general stress protein 26